MSDEIRMQVAKLLKFYRDKENLTVYQVGELIGKSGKTVSAWENNRGQPDADIFLKLCDVYKVDNVSVFFGQNILPPTSAELHRDISHQELDHIKKYRVLDERGKETVDMVLNSQYEIVLAKKQQSASLPEKKDLLLVAKEQSKYSPARKLDREEMHRKFDEELD